MLKNMKMVYKIGGGFALVSLFTLLIAGISVGFTLNARSALQTGEILSAEISRLSGAGNTLSAFFRSGNPADSKTVKDNLSKTISGVSSLLPVERDNATRDLLASVVKNLQDISSQVDAAAPKPGMSDPREAQLNDSLKKTQSSLYSVKESVNARVAKDLGSSIFTIIIATLAAFLTAIIFTVLLTRSVTGALDTLAGNAESIASGNLDLTLDRSMLARKDEVGVLSLAVSRMLERLGDFVGEMRGVAAGVASGGKKLSETSSQIASGASKQAASVEQVSASMEQMSASIRQSAENATQTERIARMSSQAAADGGKAVMETLDAMREIASKIGIIEEIARSTNMLSLNASIEAARAGEYGKGFAVVASEVGKLAERSQKEAGEISTLSLSSVEIAEKAGETISALVPDIKRTADLVQEITAALNEQKSGIESINGAITQLDRVVQENASSSELSSEMADNLADQAERMQELIGFFGDSAAKPHSASAPAVVPPPVPTKPSAPAQPVKAAETAPAASFTKPQTVLSEPAAANKSAVKPAGTSEQKPFAAPKPAALTAKTSTVAAKPAIKTAPSASDRKPAAAAPGVKPAAKPAPLADSSAPAKPATTPQSGTPLKPETPASLKQPVSQKPAAAKPSVQEAGVKPAAKPAASAPAALAQTKQRLPLTGIHLVLDDDVLPHGSDDLDNDFKEF